MTVDRNATKMIRMIEGKRNLVNIFDDKMDKSKRVERADRNATKMIKTTEAKNLLIKVGDKMQFLVKEMKTIWRLYSAIKSKFLNKINDAT